MKRIRFLLLIIIMLPILILTSCKSEVSYKDVVKQMNKNIVTDEEYAKDYSKALNIFSSDNTKIYLYASNANEAKSFTVYAIINEEVRQKTLFYSFYDTASKDTHITATVKYGKGSMLDAYKNASYYSLMYLDASFSFSPSYSLDEEISFTTFNLSNDVKLEQKAVETEINVLLDLSLNELSSYMKLNGLNPSYLGIINY